MAKLYTHDYSNVKYSIVNQTEVNNLERKLHVEDNLYVILL